MAFSVSVVIPAYNAAADLAKCLEHLKQSAVQPLEVLVVDDGSTDASAAAARERGATVISSGGRRGPAAARNFGARHARGDILFFLDADVCVHDDTVGRVQDAFQEDPELDAIIGSYDDRPEAPDFISQYKNLMHCFVHQAGREHACTFWSGCGAIRRELFLEHSGFDESYRRPAVEDIELGYRLSMAGRKLVLDKDLKVKHLKRWTFLSLVKTDIFDRGIPWTELILRDRRMPNDLNIHLSQRVSVALAFLCFGIAAVTTVYLQEYFLVPVFALLFLALGRYWVDASSQPVTRAAFYWMTLAIVALVALAYYSKMLGIVPPLLLGYVLLFIRHRYELASGKRRLAVSLFSGVYLLIAVVIIFTYLPQHILVLVFFLLLLTIVVVNNQFFLFLAEKQGRLFALAAVPFQLLYHFYNGISFLAGMVRYGWHSLAVRRAGAVKKPSSAK